MSLGQPAVEYYLVVNDPLAKRLAVIDDYISLQAQLIVSDISNLIVKLPSDYALDTFPYDGILELWRSLDGVPQLFGEKVWFIRRRQKMGALRGPGSWAITAYDPNYLFGDPSKRAGRSVAYNANNSFTLKLGTADNLAKAVVRENAGSLATDSARSLATYLTVQPDVSLAATIKKNFERRNVLAVLQEFATASAVAGTYMAFDTVCTTPPSSGGTFALEFRTYTGQRGFDHRASSGNPVLIGPDYGNLDNWAWDDDATNEANYIYAGGMGVGDVQAITPASDSARIGISPFNRRELFVNASGTGDAAALQDEADGALRAGRPRAELSGELQDSDQARFMVDWGPGDYLTGQAEGRSADMRADAVEISFDRDTGEHIRPTLRSDDV